MTLLAIAVAAYAGAAIFSTQLRTPFVADLFAKAPASALGHLAGGLIAILAGAFQVSSRMRSRSLAVHRWLGRVYVTGVLVGGVSGLRLSLSSTGGLVTHFGFGMMAVLWLGATIMAWVRIRSGNRAAHRVWMFRSYALTLAAVTLRVYLPLSQMAGLPFDQFYQAVSWLCWVPNLLVVEWFVLSRAEAAG